MKTYLVVPAIKGGWIVQFAFLIATGFLMGCTSTGYQKSGAAAVSFREMADCLRLESIALDATVASLNDLVNNPASDLKPQFKRFSHHLDELSAAMDHTDGAAKRMREKGKDYFAIWDQNIAAVNYGAIRSISLARRASVAEQFNRVNSQYSADQAVAWPMIIYLTDIRRALDTDLTAGGIESVKDIVATAQKNAGKLQTALAQLTEELASSGVQLSSVVVLNQ